MKLNVATGTPLSVVRAPIEAVHVTNKKYVDDSIAAHANDTTHHLNTSQYDLINSLLSVITDVSYFSGLTANIQSQVNSKLDKSGGTMTGFIVLHAAPTLPLHPATKQYTDDGLSAKLNLVGGVLTGFLTLHANPTDALHAVTKQYVDTKITDHSQDTNLHTTEAQKTWLNEVTISSTEANSLVGVTSNVQEQLDSKLSEDGGVVNGDISLGTEVAIHSAKTPTAETELVNKAYVDSKISGKEWKDPITSAGLLGFSLTVPPVTPVEGDSYIVGVEAVGAWVGLDGKTVQYISGAWQVLHQNRQVQPGDRYGVALKTTTEPQLELVGSQYKLITITGGVPGNYTFEEDDQTPGTSAVVFDKDAVDFGYTYTLSDDLTWSITNTSVNLTNGVGLSRSGRFLYVAAQKGLNASANNLSVVVNKNTGLDFDVQDKVQIKFDGDSIVSSLNGIRLNAGLTAVIEDSVTKAGTNLITGQINIHETGKLTSDATPVDPNDVITKQYVDTVNTNLSGLISSLTTIVTALNTDPVTKAYVDNTLTGYLQLAGGTLTGHLTLSGAPVNNLHAATKQYVDSSVTNHVNNGDVHITAGERALLADLVGFETQFDYIAGVTSPVQTQLDGKLNVSGGTMTGMLTLYSDPTLANHASTKNYVDTKVDERLSKAGGIMTGHIQLPGLPTDPSHATSKEYVDSVGTSANTYTDNAVATKLDKAGGTMTGFITLHAAPTADFHSATKKFVDDSVSALANTVSTVTNNLDNRLTTAENTLSSLSVENMATIAYVDNGLANKLDLSGGTLTGNLTLPGDPSNPLHAASKQYVDAIALGLKVRASVRLATTTALDGTYDNGSSGVGATFTMLSNGALVVDGKTAVLNDRVLVKNQTGPSVRRHGVYVVIQAGDAASPAILRRADVIDEAYEFNGSYFWVYDGEVNKGTGWFITVGDPSTFVIGNFPVLVNQFFGPTAYIAGNGMTMSGTTFQVNTANSGRIVVNADDIDLATTGVTADTYTSVTVDIYGRVLGGTKPTTLAGYGILDGQTYSARLTQISNIPGRGLLVIDNTDTATVRRIGTDGIGISINNDGTGSASSDLIISSNATPVNTANTIVSRDASGNFIANVITADLNGKANTADALQTSRTFSIAGDLVASAQSFNGTANITLTGELATTGVVAGTYKSVTVDAKGRVTGGSNPTTLAGYGITDAVTTATLTAEIDALKAQIRELYAYIQTRT